MFIVVGHVVSILMFIAVIVTVVYMAATLKASVLPPCYQWVPRVTVVLLSLQAVVYLLMQADYLLGPHGVTGVADPETSMRVLYGILNGTTLVMFSTGLNIFLRWKRKPLRCAAGCPLLRNHDRIL